MDCRGGPQWSQKHSLATSRNTKAGAQGCSYDLSDSFWTLDFSHLRAKGVGYARHRNLPKRGDRVHTLPPKMVQVLAPFAPLFSKRVFRHAQVLLIGAILAPGRRTVSSALRAMGLNQEKRFHRYHRVLSRASWSSREVSCVLLGLLVKVFVPEGEPLVVGIDETLERRWGKKISAKGVYRDPVRSTHQNFVKASGLRWVCVMLLVEIPWASRVWALPFLSCPGAFRALCRQAGQTPQEDNRVGLAVAPGAKAMVSGKRDRGRSRSRLRFLEAPRPLSQALATRSPSSPVLALDAALYEPAPPRIQAR